MIGGTRLGNANKYPNPEMTQCMCGAAEKWDTWTCDGVCELLNRV